MIKPRRKHELIIKIGGDTEDDVVDAIRNLLFYFETEQQGRLSEPCSGGPSCGYYVQYNHDPEMTNKKYFEAIKEYNNANKVNRNTPI